MADTVDTISILTGRNRIVRKFTNVSDGTGESAVTKIDISTLTGPNGSAPTKLVIEEVKWDVQGFSSVELLIADSSDTIALICSGNDYIDFRGVGGFVSDGSGGTGDLKITTNDAALNSTYDITVVCRLKD